MPTPWGEDFRACVENVAGWAENPEGFCAWIKNKEDRADEAPMGMKYRCPHCDQMVQVKGDAGSACYDEHMMGGEKCEMSGKPLKMGKSDADENRVRRFERFDFAELARPTVTAEGFLRVEGRLARTGVQHYQDSNGGIRRELRRPEDVKASVPGFALMPLTNKHPPTMLNPSNAKTYVAGAVGGANFDGKKWITAPLTVYDAEAIAALKAGRSQLSVGYQCTLVEESGEWEGERYDYKQTAISVNHVAIVDSARAGPEARVRLDGTDAEAVPCEFAAPNNGMVVSRQQEIKTMAHVLVIDGVKLEVNDQNAQVHFDRYVSGIKTAGEAAAAEVQKKLDAETASKAEQAKVIEQLNAKVSALEVVIEQGKRSDEEDKKQFPAVVRERVKLEREAVDVLGRNEKVDEKTDVEIMRLCLAKMHPGKFDSITDSVVKTTYEALMKTRQPLSQVAEARASATQVVHEVKDEKPTDPDAARQAYIERQRKAFVK